MTGRPNRSHLLSNHQNFQPSEQGPADRTIACMPACKGETMDPNSLRNALLLGAALAASITF